MGDDEASQGNSLEESTRQTNSNLQRLLEAVGGMLTASADLLARLQGLLSGSEQGAGSTPDQSGPPSAGTRGDC